MNDWDIGVVSVVASTSVALVALLINALTTTLDRRHRHRLAREARDDVERDLGRTVLLELAEWFFRVEEALSELDFDGLSSAHARNRSLNARLVLYAPQDVTETLADVDEGFRHVGYEASKAADEVSQLQARKEAAIDAQNFEEAAMARADEKQARARTQELLLPLTGPLTELRRRVQSHALTLQPKPPAKKSRRSRSKG